MSRTRLLEVGLTVLLVLMLLFLLGRWLYQIRLENTLYRAASDGDLAEVQSILSKGVNVNSQPVLGMTALMSAAASHHTEVVKVLLKAGAAVNLKAELDGTTALMQAVVMSRYGPRGATETVRVLLASGADVNAPTKDGWSPLTWARQQDELLRKKPEVVSQAFKQIAQLSASFPGVEKNLTAEEYTTSMRALCDELLRKAQGGTGQ